MSKQVNNLRIEAHGGHRACVCWDDGKRRYHIWCNSDGTRQASLHSNPLEGYVGRNGHREVDIDAKSRVKVMEKVGAFATPEKVLEAMREAAEQEKIEREAELKAARLHRLRDAVQTIIGASADDLAEALAPADVLIAAAATKLREVGQ